MNIVLRRFAETVIFHCAHKYCVDLRRRRIRAKTAQTNNVILAREVPYPGQPKLCQAARPPLSGEGAGEERRPG